MNPVIFWKTVHVLSAAVLLGTGAGIAFFCWFGYRSAMRSGIVGALRTVLRLTVIADACFTAPAVVVQAASGLMLSSLYGWPLISPWSVAVWGLFLLVGACWLPVVWIQARLAQQAKSAVSIADLPLEFHRWFRLWFALGVPAFVAVVALYYLMVSKALPVV